MSQEYSEAVQLMYSTFKTSDFRTSDATQNTDTQNESYIQLGRFYYLRNTC